MDKNGAHIILWWHRLLERFAEKLCDCRASGDRPADPDEHSTECPYRSTVNGTGES